MSREEMQKALETGFNKQGRHVSESMRIKYLTALSTPEPQQAAIEYRGFTITGHERYFVDGIPQLIFSSIPKAKQAIDRCLETRELMKEEV